MARSEVEDFQLYFNRIRPVYHQLFNIAHAITGNCEQAEYCLQYAMLDCWSTGDSNASHHGFREGLRTSVTRAALKSTAAQEFDWNGLLAEPGNSDPLLAIISQESAEVRRVLTLRHGCGLPVQRIARITGSDVSRVQTILRRFEARTRRKLSTLDRRRYDLLIMRSIRSQLSHPSPLAPEMGSVFRTFQADAQAISRPSRLPTRILRVVCGAVLAVICVLAFWFTAVLLQPPVLEEPVPPSAVESIAE